MATGPLSLLGEAIANGTRDFANIRLAERENERRRTQDLQDYERQRNDALTDEARRRQQALGDRDNDRSYETLKLEDARAYETQQYLTRRFDQVKAELVRVGALSPADADKPEAVQAALAKTGIDYARKVEELASIKATMPRIIEAVGNIPGADKVMSAKPEDLEAIKPIVEDAYRRLGARVDTDRSRKEDNAKTAAALIAVELNNMNRLQTQMQALDAGGSEEDQRAAFVQAAGVVAPGKTEAQLTPSERAAVAQEAQKILQESMQVKRFYLQQEATGIQRRFDNIAENARAGVYSYLKDYGFTGGGMASGPGTATTPPATLGAGAPPQTQTATAEDAAAALGEIRGNAPAPSSTPPAKATTTPAPAPVPTAPPPALGTYEPVDVPTAASRSGLSERQIKSTRNNDAISNAVVSSVLGTVDFFRPSNWQGDMNMAYFDPTPENEFRSLNQQLSRLADKNSPLAVRIKNRIAEITSPAAYINSRPSALGID